MNAFALWLKLKIRYRNGVIYDYTPEKISNTFKVSVYHVKKLIPILENMGLVKICNYKNEVRIIIESFRKISTGNNLKKNADIHMTDSLDVVVAKLRAILFLFTINRQRKLVDVTTNLKELKLKWRTLKRLTLKYQKTRNGLDNVDTNIYSGYRLLANACGISIASTKKMLLYFVKFGIIKQFKRYIIEADETHNEFLLAEKYSLHKGYYFSKNKTVYKHLGTIFVF